MTSEFDIQTTLLPLQIEPVVRAALLEDLGLGDVTTDGLAQNAAVLRQRCTAWIRARRGCVVSGLTVARCVFSLVDSGIEFRPQLADGDSVPPGAVLAEIHGPTASILKAERTALNFLQHLSGIATETRRYVDAITGTGARVTDTRKTTPGLRLLEKQAVQHGGGSPHRFNLGAAAMLKDNHLAAAGGIGPAVAQLRRVLSHTAKIEVEVDTPAQVHEALAAGADIILLDNFTPAQVREAVALIGNRAVTEASGGLTLDTLHAYAETGVQYLSTSQITLGAPAVDIGLDFE